MTTKRKVLLKDIPAEQWYKTKISTPFFAYEENEGKEVSGVNWKVDWSTRKDWSIEADSLISKILSTEKLTTRTKSGENAYHYFTNEGLEKIQKFVDKNRVFLVKDGKKRLWQLTIRDEIWWKDEDFGHPFENLYETLWWGKIVGKDGKCISQEAFEFMAWMLDNQKVEIEEEVRNILLVGHTGVGKSSLANVLMNNEPSSKFNIGGVTGNPLLANWFSDSSQFKRFESPSQSKLFEKDGYSYQVIDTPGIGNTSLSESEMLQEIANAVKAVEEGVHQIFFVIDDGITEQDINAFRLLLVEFFDPVAVNHTAIIRTKFGEFRNMEACDKDIENLRNDSNDLARLFDLVGGRVIHVNISELSGKESSERLWTYLRTLRNKKNYLPQNLRDLNRKIAESSIRGEEVKEVIRNHDRSITTQLRENFQSGVGFGAELGEKIGGNLGPLGRAVGGTIGATAGTFWSAVGTPAAAGFSLFESLTGKNKERGNRSGGSGNSVNQQLENLRKEIKLKEQQINDQNQAIARLEREKTQSSGATSSLNQQIKDSQKERDRLDQELTKLKTAKQNSEAELNRTITELRQQITESKTKLDQLQKEKTTLTQQNQEKEKKIGENQTEISGLEQQVKTLQQRIQVLQRLLNNVPEMEAKVQQSSTFPSTGNN